MLEVIIVSLWTKSSVSYVPVSITPLFFCHLWINFDSSNLDLFHKICFLTQFRPESSFRSWWTADCIPTWTSWTRSTGKFLRQNQRGWIKDWMFFDSIRAYKACFTSSCTAKNIFFFQENVAPPRGTLRTLIDREWERDTEKKAQHPVGFKPKTSLSRGVCFTAVQEHLHKIWMLVDSKLHFIIKDGSPFPQVRLLNDCDRL